MSIQEFIKKYQITGLVEDCVQYSKTKNHSGQQAARYLHKRLLKHFGVEAKDFPLEMAERILMA